MALFPNMSSVVAPVQGADAAKLIGLRAIAKNQKTIYGLTSVAPGLGYSQYIFLIDLVQMSESYPGFFTADYLRPALDAFVGTIGLDPIGPDVPAGYFSASGPVFRPGVGSSYYPTFDNAVFLTLLAAQIYDRGDTSVYNLYKTEMSTALAAAPRDGNNLIYSNPAQPTTGWSFEDALVTANWGGLGAVSAYHAVAYQKLASMATAEGDTAGAASFTAQANLLIAGLQTLRRVDGYYDGCTGDPKPHVPLSAMMVYFGFDTAPNLAATSAALLADYNASSAFAGIGAPGGNIAQRGGTRHLVYPNYVTTALNPQGEYHNGGAWIGPWVGWVAYALAQADLAKGQELLQSAVNEILRQNRVNGAGPWEWTNLSAKGTDISPTVTGVLAFASDTATPTLTIPGVPSSTGTLVLPEGTTAGQYRLSTATPATVTVLLEAASETNVLADPVPIVTPTYSAYQAITPVSLAGSTLSTPAVSSANLAAFGGKVKATVMSGSSTDPLTLEPLPLGVTPDFIPIPVLDSYIQDRLADDYLVAGPGWAVTGGKLVNTGAAFATALWKTNGAVLDGDFVAYMSSSDIANRQPVLMLRSMDGLTGLTVTLMPDRVEVGEFSSGAYYLGLGYENKATVDNEIVKVRVQVVGSIFNLSVNDGPFVSNTITISLAAGYFGPMANAGTGNLSWDDLTFAPYTNSRLVPSGHLLTSSTNGYLPGELPSEIISLALRQPDGTAIASWASGLFQFNSGLSFTSVNFYLSRASVIDQTHLKLDFTYPPDLPLEGIIVQVNGVTQVVTGAVASTPNSVILSFAQKLPNGTGTAAATTTTSNGAPIVPSTVYFTVALAEAPISLQELPTKTLPPPFKGPGFDAILAALDAGDVPNASNARSAYYQSLLHTATGQYLDQLAARYGVYRPLLNDDHFRAVVEILKQEELTGRSLWRFIQAMYGVPAARAFAYCDCPTGTTFAFPYGSSMDLTFERRRHIRVPIPVATSVTPEELVGYINATLAKEKYDGYAEYTNTDYYGFRQIRIYSAALGHDGAVEVGGVCQYGTASLLPALGFNTRIVASSNADSFTFTKSGTTISVTGGFPDLSDVREGDWIVMQQEFGVNAGTFKVTSVTPPTPYATISYENAAGASAVVLATLGGFMVVRPTVYRLSMDASNRANEISAAVTNVNHTTYIKLPLQPILDGGDFIDSFYLAPGQQYYIVGNVQQSVNVTAGEHSMVEIPVATPPADPFWGVFNIGGQSQLGPYRMFPTATGVKTQAGLILPAMPNASLVRVEYGTVNLGSVVTDDAAQRQFVLDTLDSMLAVGKDYVVEDKVN